MGKIISYKNALIEKSYSNIQCILDLVKEDEKIEVTIKEVEIKILLEEFYALYEKKYILYLYPTDMDLYFGEIFAIAQEEEEDVTLDFLMDSLSAAQDLVFPVEITKRDSNKMMKQAYQKIKKIGGKE